MLQSQTAVLERNTVLTGEFFTEPFEVAWAREARWYVQILETKNDASVSFVTQVSPDGLTWVDLNSDVIRTDHAPLTSWAVAEFGPWLRVRGNVTGEDASVKVRIYLSIKS